MERKDGTKNTWAIGGISFWEDTGEIVLFPQNLPGFPDNHAISDSVFKWNDYKGFSVYLSISKG